MESARNYNKLAYVTEKLSQLGVDHRIIGSKALELYGLAKPSNGDIDILVPRHDMSAMPEVRKGLRREFGRTAVLGTFPSMTTVNFNPEGTSVLEHREIEVSLDDSTMSRVEIDGISTLQPQSLGGLYETIGGFMKDENIEPRDRLLQFSDIEVDPAFGHFRDMRNLMYPHYSSTKRVLDKMTRLVPKGVRLAAQDVLESRLERHVQ